MTKIEFLFHLQGASYQALKFAECYVKTELKTNFKYNVIFADDNADPKIKLNLIDKEVIDILYINDKIPIWIDINVLKSSKSETTFNLLCSKDYSNNKEEYYYNRNGSGPFGVKSPILPPNYKEGEKFEF